MPETVTLINVLIMCHPQPVASPLKNSERMIDTQTPDFFLQIDVTGGTNLEPMDEPGPNSVPDNGLLFIATVCYTEIIDLRMP